MNNTNYNYNENVDLSKYKGLFKFIGGVVAAFIIINIIFNAVTFTVDEREQVVVRQFGEVVTVILDEYTEDMKNAMKENSRLKDIKILEGKGLFLKIPFIQSTESYTNMLLTYDTNPREVITKDKKKLVLDNFAQWKIVNPALFLDSIGNEGEAHKRLDEIIYSKLNEEIGKVEANVVISDKQYVSDMTDRMIETTNNRIKEYGMEIVDIKIKRTDLPVENYEKVFNRMRTERERAAKTYRSEGKEQAQITRSKADKEATILEAQAYETAEKVKGEGDAEALKIYAEAYNQDPEFYAFWRTLQVYRNTLNEKTKIVIDPESEFAKYLFDIK